jgi:hypothetical protein
MMKRYLGILLLCLTACTHNTATKSTAQPPFEPVNADPTLVARLDPTRCYFFGFGIGAPFQTYIGPDLADQTTTGLLVDADELYEIVAESEDRYQIDAGDDGLVWVNRRYGMSQGGCADLPIVSTRPDPPVGVCTVRYHYPQEFDVFAEPGGGEVIGVMPWGEYVEIIGTVSGQSLGFKVRLNNGMEGYVKIPHQSLFYNGSISGPCDNLPVEDDPSLRG